MSPRTREIPAITMEEAVKTAFPNGKHKGELVNDVLKYDKGYCSYIEEYAVSMPKAVAAIRILCATGVPVTEAAAG